MLFDLVAATSEAVASTPKRLGKVAALAETLARTAPAELPAVVRWLGGELRQPKLGLGWASVRDAVVAPAAAATLTVAEVDAAFDTIAGAAGAGSTKHRRETLATLLARATAREQALLRGLVTGELRQGALESLVLEALAKAAGVAPAAVRRAWMLAGDLGAVARTALAEGEDGLARYALELFVPVQPMLASPAASLEEVFAAHPRAAFELKLDGARVQVHKAGGEVRVYSRLRNEVTERVPEIVEAVRALDADPLVLDGECLTLTADAAPQPFQVTMRRFGRRIDVEALRAELPLHGYFFDVLRLGDRTLLGEPAEIRFAALDALVPPALRVPRLVAPSLDEARTFVARAIEAGHEGVMAKALDAPYEAGHRGAAWLKLKAAHTLDLVVLAAEWGSGRRTGWLSNLHLGARDPEVGGFVMLGKTFKGMTDALLAWQTEKLLALETRREGHVVHVRPELVVEIAVGDVQRSPHYPGGVALRFARVKRYRDDKRPEDADPIERVLELAERRAPAVG